MASQGPPFKVRAIFDYESTHDDDLTFVTGEIITVISVEDDDWYLGEYTDKATGEKREGIFPMNFVEKIVAELPPRPSRTKKAPEPKEPEPVAEAPQARVPSPAPASPPQPIPKQAPKSEPVVASPPPPPKVIQSISAEPVKAKLPPPPPTEKSQNVASSFRDRIAAFNKLETQAPIKPVAPWGGSGSKPSFVKKPFVPPPPSKNAYIPPVVSHLPKPRRDEDAPRDAPDFTSQSPLVEEAPVKISSLKDRIAALQNQNMHLDPTGKPKSKPPKPKPRTEIARTESESSVAGITPVPGQVPLASQVTEGDLGGPDTTANEPTAVRNVELEDDFPSKDTVDLEQSVVVSGKARKSVEVKRTAAGFSDEGAESAGDADVSSSGGHEPEVIEPKATSGRTARQSEDKSDDGDNESANDDAPGGVEGVEEEEAEGEEGIDPEVARKLALRERMMKMSGGMGMHGMVFGPPMGGMPPKKKTTEQRASGETEKQEGGQGPAPAMIPIFPMGGFGLPGMKPPAKQTDKPEFKEPESDSEQLTSVEISAENVNDGAFVIEDSKEPPKPAPTSLPDSTGGSVVKTMERAPPPPPPPVSQGLFNL